MTSLHEGPVSTIHDQWPGHPRFDGSSAAGHRKWRWLVAAIGIVALLLAGVVWWLLEATVPASDYDDVVAELEVTENELASARAEAAALRASDTDFRSREVEASGAAFLLAYFAGLEQPDTDMAPRWDRSWAGVVSRDLVVERIGDPELTKLYWEYLAGGVGGPDPAVATNEFIVRLVELTIEPLVEER